jgi:hypothetical protein
VPVDRPIQQSLIPELARPLGTVPGSVQVGDNADLIATLAPLYLTGSVLDVTYGQGGWWRRFTPDPFVAHDLTTDGVNFTDLPHPDGSFDAVTFDPPYIPQGGTNHLAATEWGKRYGITVSRTMDDMDQMFTAGMAEAARVSRQWVLVKCTDHTMSSELVVGSVRTVNIGTALGLVVHDLIVHHTGAGPGGHNIMTIRRCRRHHSYLLVFRVKRGGDRGGGGLLQAERSMMGVDVPPW